MNYYNFTSKHDDNRKNLICKNDNDIIYGKKFIYLNNIFTIESEVTNYIYCFSCEDIKYIKNNIIKNNKNINIDIIDKIKRTFYFLGFENENTDNFINNLINIIQTDEKIINLINCDSENEDESEDESNNLITITQDDNINLLKQLEIYDNIKNKINETYNSHYGYGNEVFKGVNLLKHVKELSSELIQKFNLENFPNYELINNNQLVNEHNYYTNIINYFNNNINLKKEFIKLSAIGKVFDITPYLIYNNTVLELSSTPITSLVGVNLPQSLIELYLYYTQIKSLVGVDLPQSLKILSLSYTPIQSLVGVNLPQFLEKLDLYYTKIKSLVGVILPQSLEELNLYGTPIKSLLDVDLPQSLKILNLSHTQIKSLVGVKLPQSIKKLVLYYTKIKSLVGVILPQSLEELNLYGTEISQQEILNLRNINNNLKIVFY